MIAKTAELFPCRRYRYSLTRTWDNGKPHVLFIGLNPSTADELTDDATIRRCMRFAESWGYGGIVMANLFAFRSRHPKIMKESKDPVGPENNQKLTVLSTQAGLIVAAWGTHGNYKGRDNEVKRLIPGMKCLGTTKDGHPKHPLFLKSNTLFVAFE